MKTTVLPLPSLGIVALAEDLATHRFAAPAEEVTRMHQRSAPRAVRRTSSLTRHDTNGS